MLGRTVGRYKIIGKLGEGGMGSVWKAEDPLLGRTVALKFLPDNLVDSVQARRRFLREARATSALQHPGIATLFDTGEEEGQLYIAVQFVDGETVSDKVSQGPLPLPEAIRIAAEAADALEHAHSRGLIHRDVTARNIMVARDGRVVLIDFGLALRPDTTRITTSGTAVGTVAYIAPEIVRDRSADHRSDIYSLGVVLYEMLTGLLPFSGERSVAMIYAALNEKPAPPSERRTGLNPRLDRIVLKAMAKEPVRRYPSAALLAADLRTLEEPAAAGEGPGRESRRASRQRRSEPGSTLRRMAGPALPARKSLAVLPFRDLGTPEGQDSKGALIARGLAETLSASLSRVPHLQVIPPSQAASAPELESGDLRTAARRLGANLLLSGTIRRVGGQLRVSYSLLDPRHGTALAGDKLDGSTADLFAVEDALLTSVIRSLRVEAAERTRRGPGLAGPASHEQYLQALGYLQRTDNEASVDGAIRILEGLVLAEGDTALVHAALGKAYLFKHDLSRQPEWKKKAQESCRLALSLDPHSPGVLVTLGRLHVQTGRYDEAIDAFRRSIELQKDNPDALQNLCRAYMEAGQFKEAERAARDTIALRPGQDSGYHRLGMVYYRQGRFELAVPQWEKVVQLVPDGAAGHRNVAAAYYKLGRLEDALAAYGRSVELMPHATAYSGMGTVHFFLGQHKEAIAMFQKAVALTPRDPRAWRNLGDSQRWIPGLKAGSAESFDRAIALLREHLETNPKDAEAWSDLARCLAKRGRTAESLDAARRAFEMAPHNVSCMARAITVYELAGDRERAVAFLKEAVEAGCGLVELERDPELEDLRREPEVQNILREGEASRAGKGA